VRQRDDRGAKPRPEVQHIAGRGFHSLRRKFATELKDTPLNDLSRLSGWKEPMTVVRCYQKPDDQTMRAALERRRVVNTAPGC
jgi:integrase